MFDVLVDGMRAYLVWTTAAAGTAMVFGVVRFACVGAAATVKGSRA